ncbi:MAG: rhomboid family intramembrane serine protease [Bacteroidota bacterium]
MLSQTIIIIIFTALTSFLALNNQKVYGDLIMYPPAVNKGQYYRLLTSGFIHADFNHLIFNMLTLYFFGRTVEEAMGTIIGKYGFLALYLGGIIVSDIPSYLKNRNNNHYASLGASGGVSAVVFSFIMFAPWAWFAFPPVPAIVYGIGYLFYCIYMSKKGGDGINHDAHFWGALYGVVFTLINEPKMGGYFLNQLMHPQGP